MSKGNARSRNVSRERVKVQRRRLRRRQARVRKLRSASITVAVLAAVVGLGLFAYRSGTNGVSFAGDIRAGGRLQELSLPRLEGSGRIDYAQLSDRPLVVNFFASWCPNCIAEMPGFEQVHRELEDRVTFLGISQSDSRGASIDLADRTGITYLAGIDAQGAFFHATGSLGMPTTLFIRPGGEIAYIQVGALDPAALKHDIQRYLGVQV